MKKRKMSMKEKKKIKFLCTMLLFSLGQMFIILSFIYITHECQLLEIEDTKSATITVEETKLKTIYSRRSSSKQLSIYSDSVEYNFPNTGIFSNEYTSRELYEIISVGDQLTIYRNNIWRYMDFVFFAEYEFTTKEKEKKEKRQSGVLIEEDFKNE